MHITVLLRSLRQYVVYANNRYPLYYYTHPLRNVYYNVNYANFINYAVGTRPLFATGDRVPLCNRHNFLKMQNFEPVALPGCAARRDTSKNAAYIIGTEGV